MIALLLAGCVRHVLLDSRPSSALVVLPGGAAVVTPAEIELRWTPFRRELVTVSAPGYRTVELDLRRHPMRGGYEEPPDVPVFRIVPGEGPPRVELVLVAEHGPAGTWTEADVP